MEGIAILAKPAYLVGQEQKPLERITENICLLIKESEAIEKIGFTILFSSKRNSFFFHLENHIKFHNGLKHHLKAKNIKENSKLEIIENIPELHFEDYSTSTITQFFLLLSFPISFIIFILQWNYVKEIKFKLKEGIAGFEKLLTK